MTWKLSVLTLVERRFKGPGTGAERRDLSLALLFPPSTFNVDLSSATFDNAASSFVKINIFFSPNFPNQRALGWY